MSLSPKHTTPFSVTDILSPLEESYKKTTIEAAIPPLNPYGRSTSQAHQTSMSSMSSMGSAVANYPNAYMPQLSHSAGFPSQYCNGTDLYGDAARHSSTGWGYGGNPDPRFASTSK